MTPTSLLVTLLWLSAAPAADGPQDEAPSASSAEAAYADALAKLEEAQALTNDEPAAHVARLRDAINFLTYEHGEQLRQDPDGQQRRVMAQLTLARALFNIEDAEAARDAMDEAIRTSRGDPLPVRSFGPGLSALHKEREQALSKAGSGSIDITCNSPCRVYVNERPAPPTGIESLPLGAYRLVVEDRKGETETLEKIVKLETPDFVEKVIYAEVAPVEGGGPILPAPRERTRMMPRWAEATIMVGGAVAAGFGGLLWGIAGKCPLGAEERVNCPLIYITRPAGIITVAAGGALFLGGAITLSIDEVRMNKAKDADAPAADPSATRVSVGWTLRF